LTFDFVLFPASIA